MSRDDRNTAIIVAVVLVVCTVSLLVIGGYLFRLIIPGLSSTFNTLGLFVKVNTTNYNFPVPKATSAVNPDNGATTPVFQLPAGYTYNFGVPANDGVENGEVVAGISDTAILADAAAAGYGAATVISQPDGSISIPAIGINSPIYVGNTGSELNRGFWKYPNSDSLILLCQRQYFAVEDFRSCWDIDKLQVGNEIFLSRADTTIRYVIKDITTLTNVDTGFKYPASSNLQDLQIVTSNPLFGGQDRLIITAKQQPQFN